MPIEIAMFLFLALVILGRMLSERAMRQLTSEQKATIVDAFSQIRAYGLIPVVVLGGGYFLVGRYTEMSLRSLEILIFSGLVTYIVVFAIYTNVKMRALGLPSGFLKRYAVAHSIQFAGIGIFFVGMASAWLNL
ncbi:hypothetical protein [Vreelandella utahensis]|uniref:hypothetical protein n=1 Tax=Vreelandella halophila TaxID=86177 RepID=UPI00098659A5|nr:hypothetical protein [Halomonas utahensis]